MYSDKLVVLITKNGGDLYAPPRCFELDGHSYDFSLAGKTVQWKFGDIQAEAEGSVFDYNCLKRSDGVYLVEAGDKFVFVNDNNGVRAIITDDAVRFIDGCDIAPTDELDGWNVEITFAAGNAARCRFVESGIEIDGNTTGAKVFGVGEDMYLVVCDTLDGQLAFLMDTGRFMFSGFLKGKMIVGGYLESVAE